MLGGLSGLLSRQIRAQQRSINRETTRNAGFITECLRNVALIKSLGLTYREIRRLQAQTEQIFALEMAKVRRIRWLSFLQGSTLSLLKLSVLFTLLWLIFRNVLSTGELIAMQFISVAILAPLQELGTIILAWREASASMANFAELMAKPVERRPPDAVPIGPIDSLRFEDVVFRHRGAKENALDGVSFSAARGDTIAFVGPSGSGKSTLVKLLLGLYRPARGEVYYNGVGSRQLRYNEARRQVGYVTQETSLFAGTVRENMLFVRPDATDAESSKRWITHRARTARPAAQGAGHGGRRIGRQALGRRAPAPLDRAGPAARAAPLDLRRGDLGAGLDHRGTGDPDRAPDLGRAHADHAGDRPPPVHRAARRHHLRAREGPHRGKRRPMRSCWSSRGCITRCGASRSGRGKSPSPGKPAWRGCESLLLRRQLGGRVSSKHLVDSRRGHSS